MFSRSIHGLLSLALAAVLFVVGCSSLPSSPSRTAAGDRASATGAAASSAAARSATAASQRAGASRTVLVRAIYGGTVRAGSFSVVIPPGALKADGIVTLRQADFSQPVVDLSITPEDRNSFLLPVRLVADAAPMDSTLLATSRLSRWEPDSAKWAPLAGSRANLADATVEAPLRHFSKYRLESGDPAGR